MLCGLGLYKVFLQVVSPHMILRCKYLAISVLLVYTKIWKNDVKELIVWFDLIWPIPAFNPEKFTDNWKRPAQLWYSKLSQYKLAIPQVKTTNYGLHSIGYRTAKHWNSVQNNLKLNFANNFVSSKKFVKAFKKNIHSGNPTIIYFQRCSINLILCL